MRYNIGTSIWCTRTSISATVRGCLYFQFKAI
nr:MAG TPA: hypothetical protein [Caudoviricetes sp.]